jgi:hypothetical protein
MIGVATHIPLDAVQQGVCVPPPPHLALVTPSPPVLAADGGVPPLHLLLTFS